MDSVVPDRESIYGGHSPVEDKGLSKLVGSSGTRAIKMADESLHTRSTEAPEYHHWTASSLQERARMLGLNHRGLNKDQLVQLLEENSQREESTTDGGQALPSEDRPEPPSPGSRSP